MHSFIVRWYYVSLIWYSLSYLRSQYVFAVWTLPVIYILSTNALSVIYVPSMNAFSYLSYQRVLSCQVLFWTLPFCLIEFWFVSGVSPYIPSLHSFRYDISSAKNRLQSQFLLRNAFSVLGPFKIKPRAHSVVAWQNQYSFQ